MVGEFSPCTARVWAGNSTRSVLVRLICIWLSDTACLTGASPLRCRRGSRGSGQGPVGHLIVDGLGAMRDLNRTIKFKKSYVSHLLYLLKGLYGTITTPLSLSHALDAWVQKICYHVVLRVSAVTRLQSLYSLY